MPRDGNGVATKPAGTTATPNTLIESSKFNSVIDDIYALLNAALPITAGGTSAVSKQGAVSALFDGTTIVDDDNFTLAANGDQTKLLSLDLSGLTTATTRTIKAPDASGTAYLTSTVVGTVTQSGGVPTGAIIETGTDGTSRYILFADGTMEAWATVTTGALAITTAFQGGFRSGGQTWTYPVAFAAAPVVTISAVAQSAFGAIIADQTTSPTTSLVYVFTSVTSDATTPPRVASLHAKGRWYS